VLLSSLRWFCIAIKAIYVAEKARSIQKTPNPGKQAKYGISERKNDLASPEINIFFQKVLTYHL
jgi:hypothetical protein